MAGCVLRGDDAGATSTDGRHATVSFTEDWRADAERRDFTINALYCDAKGNVHDPLGAYGDLLDRRVRFVGDPHQRIREDYLRILRFFRFHARYGRVASTGRGSPPRPSSRPAPASCPASALPPS